MDGTRDCVQADSEPDGGDVNRAESLLTSCDRRRKVENPKRQPFINILQLVASFSGTDVKSYGNAFLTDHGVKFGGETFVIALTAAHVVCPTADSPKVADRTFDRRPEDIAQSLRVAIASEKPAVSSLEFILGRGQPNGAENYGWYEVAPSWVNADTPETAATRWSEDYAALFLKKNMLPPECMGPYFHVQDPQMEPIKRSITCAGYTCDKKWAGAMLWTVGYLYLPPQSSMPMDPQACAWHTADTDRGVSGSPLYVDDGSRSKPFTVLAIHHMSAPSKAKDNPGYNEALPVDITLIKKLMAFPKPQGWMGESGGPNSEEVFVPPVSLSETTELQDLSSLGEIPPPKPHQRSSSPIVSKATDGREEDQPRPDNLDRIQSSHGNFHQPEQSQLSQVTTELADLAKTSNSSPVSSEEHDGPAARATHVKQRLGFCSSVPTTPCAAGIDIHLPVFGAELGDHPPTPSSQIIQHQLDPEMTDFAKDKLMRRDTRKAQLSSDGRAPNTRSVPRNGGSGDSSDAATAMTSDTVDALASLSLNGLGLSSRSQGGARHTAPAAPSFCPPPSKPAAVWTVSLPVYHSSDYPSHEERAEGCHSEPEQEQAPRRHMFAFKLKQDWPRRTHDRARYLTELYAYGVEKKKLVTYYVHQFGEVFFSFEVDELSTVQKALSSGVKIRKEHVDILRGVYRVEVQGCPLRTTPEDVRKLLSQYGLVLAVPDRDRMDANAYHGEYYADMLLSQEYAAKSRWDAKTRCESWVQLKKLQF